jgi:hypothetical protein
MGFWSSVGSLISGGISAVGSLFSGIGSAIGGFAKNLIAILPPIGIPPIIIIGLIIKAIDAIGRALGIIEEKESAEELGAKAMDAEKKWEDFESTQAYIEYLREKVAFDRQKFETLSSEEKIACQAVGISIESKAIAEKKGIEIPEVFWGEVGRQKMEGAEAEAYIDSFKVGGESLDKFSGYLKGDLTSGENLRVSPILENAIKQLNPEISPEDIAKKVNGMQETARMKNPEQV